jgi:prevent-host-death family protein
MHSVAATQFKEHYGEYLESALAEPLIIQKYNRNSLVLLSYKTFDELAHIKEAYNDLILKLKMDNIKQNSEYIEKSEAIKRLKAYSE